MTEKDLNLTLATLTFLVQSLVRQQTKRIRGKIFQELESATQDKSLPLYGLTMEEVRASVDSFLKGLE